MSKLQSGNGVQWKDSRSQRGTVESLAEHESSSLGSDPELNGVTNTEIQTDKYGFIGGAQQSAGENADIPPDVLRQREAKWLDMLNSWDKWMAKKHKKVKLRCQKGIPPSLRGRAWLYLSGGKVKKEQNQGKFQELDSQPGDPKWLDVIEKDLHRQFPFHEMFVARGGHGQQDLFRVLKAYTLHRPEEGYCQAQAPIAAVLLMHMPAEDAFWGLVQICEKYLPGYYSAGLEAIQLDGEILFALLKRVSPVAHRHLKKYKIDPILYMTEWFMCAFSRTLPWVSVLRVWDMFFCEGVKIIFRVGLVLLKCMLGSQEKLKACQGQYETMELLRSIEPQYMQEAFLVQEVIERCKRDGIVRFGIAILKQSADIQKFIKEIELIASTPTENYMFNVSSEQALINIAGTLGDRIFNIEGTSQGQEFQLEMSQVGFSAHQTNKKDVIMLGAVGAYGWSGTVVHHTAGKPHIFLKNAFEKTLDDRNHSSLLGYSVTSVSDGSSEFYVAGAPRAVHRGQVIVYSVNSQNQPVIIDSQKGDQIGSYFGSVLCPVDVNADGVTDLLLVGAPMYMSEEKSETGRVYLFTITKGILSHQGVLEGPSALENARFGTAITAVPDLNLDNFSDVVVGAPLEGNGQGAIYIYYGDKKTIRKQSSQKILGSKLGSVLRFFGRSLDSRVDMNSDSIPDISVGAAGKAVQLWSRGVAAVTTTVSFNPEKISILSKPCMFGGRMVSCVLAKVCFRSKFRPTVSLGEVDIKYNLTLDADLQSSRATSRAQFDNSERLIQKSVSVSDKESCVDHNVYVQETPDFVSPVALRVDISPQNQDKGPALDAFQPKAWEFFIPFVKDCGSDDKCSCDLKLTVKAVNVSSSSSLLISPDRRRLSFIVTVTNMKENAYNTRVSANFSSNLFYASFTPPKDKTEVKCSSKTGSLDCRVGYPTLTPGQTVTFEINFDFSLNQIEKQAVVNFEVQSDSEEEVTSDNKVSLSIPVQYDAEIILTRNLNLDFCGIGPEDQVKHSVSVFDDIGPEFDITLRVSTGTFPINQARLTVSLPTSTKAGNPLLYVTSVQTAPVVNVQCDSSHLIDPLKIREKTHTARFTKESFRGTAELDCKAAKCETMTCVLKDLEMKTNYFVNITTRIWNGTFAFADFQTVLVAGSSEIQTPQPDLIVVTHKQQQVSSSPSFSKIKFL
uniref:Integrin subunit alpha 2 n=1 Tax=Cyprinus carpio TaxID=7962 RepID=A0A8C1ZAR7_CYPCA